MACAGDLRPLGFLGTRIHFRCRNCGMDHMTSVDHMEEEEIEQMMLAIEVDIANDNV
jgi:hypothetical protein|tara:strand:+ start:46 stop:216 length:171 start_codon:yes stop_codon:yes gene_type:complete